jgi:hypothetical protein
VLVRHRNAASTCSPDLAHHACACFSHCHACMLQTVLCLRGMGWYGSAFVFFCSFASRFYSFLSLCTTLTCRISFSDWWCVWITPLSGQYLCWIAFAKPCFAWWAFAKLGFSDCFRGPFLATHARTASECSTDVLA